MAGGLAPPVVEPDPTDGQVVITRFDCPSYRSLLLIRLLHARLKFPVRRRTRGLRGVKLFVDMRRRIVYSVSLWENLDSIYSMGEVPGHVEATRLPRGFGIDTRCGVFSYVGDWRRVLFGLPVRRRSPLHPGTLPDRRSGSRKNGKDRQP